MIEKDRFAKYTADYQSLYSVGDNVFDVDGVVVTVNLSNNQIATNAEGIEFKVAYVVPLCSMTEYLRIQPSILTT